MNDKKALDALFGKAEPSTFAKMFLEGEVSDIIPEPPKKKEIQPKEVDEKERITRTLFLGNLPASITPRDIKKLFQNVESVRLRNISLPKNIKVPRKIAVKRGLIDTEGTCSAYVVFKTPKQVDDAIEQYNGKVMFDKLIRADYATLPNEHTKVDKDTNKRTVFIGHLPWDTTEEELKEYFEVCGTLEHIRVPKDEKGKGRGIAYVTYKEEEPVELALRFNNKVFKGNEISVVRSNPHQAMREKRKKEYIESKGKKGKDKKDKGKKDKFKGKERKDRKGDSKKEEKKPDNKKPGVNFEGKHAVAKDENNSAIQRYLKLRKHVLKKRAANKK